MFGHEMFSSSAATPSASDRMRATSTYSSSVEPQMLTMLRAPQLAQPRQLLGDEAVHADALQPDGVQHARRRLDDALGRVALAFGQEQALADDAAERRQVDDVLRIRAP